MESLRTQNVHVNLKIFEYDNDNCKLLRMFGLHMALLIQTSGDGGEISLGSQFGRQTDF